MMADEMETNTLPAEETMPMAAEAEADIPRAEEEIAETDEAPATESPGEESVTPAADSSDNGPKNVQDLSIKMELTGKVAKIELSGAIIDLGLDRPGFLHISQLSTERVNNVTDVVNEGDTVQVYVLDLDKGRGRVSLTMIPPPALTWGELEKLVNKAVPGTVVRLEKFGAFVDIGAERPGLIHVSELSEEYVGSPDAVVSVGEEIEAKIIGVDVRKRQIDLSMKALSTSTVIEDDADEDEGEDMTAMEFALRKAMANAEGKGKKRRKKGRNAGMEQEDILSRTLQMQKND